MDRVSGDPRSIYELYGAGFRSHVFRIALSLDVFSPLADGPASAKRVAEAVGGEVTGVRAVLDYMVGVKMLSWDPTTGYELTETAAAFLLPGSKTYSGDYILQHSDPVIWSRALDAIQGRPQPSSNFSWEQDAWLESYREDRIPESLQMWEAAGIEASDAPLQILDLGCGCGIKSLALGQKSSAVNVTLVDTAEVLEVARDCAARLGVSERVTFVAGDALTAELPERAFDAVLVGQLTYYLTEPQNRALFDVLHHSLGAGGTAVIDAVMLGEEPSIWASTVTLLAMSGGGGRAHPFSDYERWMLNAGFSEVERLSDHWTSATRK